MWFKQLNFYPINLETLPDLDTLTAKLSEAEFAPITGLDWFSEGFTAPQSFSPELVFPADFTWSIALKKAEKVLPASVIREILDDKVAEIIKASDDIETELFAWGKMPLAYSSRCFTARHYNLNKDGCEFRCLDYEQGMDMNTREDKPFLTINGIQTMSYGCQNLLPHHEDLRQIGVNMLRLSPQMHGMAEIVRIHRDVLDGKTALADALPELERLTTGTLVDGYWHGQPGIEAVKEEYYGVA